MQRVAAAVLIIVLFSALALAQQPCQPPQVLTGSGQRNIFTDEQEVDLGDAIAEHIQHEYRVIEDDAVTAYLSRIGDRIVKHLPPNKLQFRFFLVDLQEANAFAMPGGRVYVSRKLVAFARTEDELAGILGHEMGHVLAHQTAIRMTRLMQDLLGVTEVKDRRDIFEKYNQLMDNRARKPKAFKSGEGEEDKHQVAADQIGLFAVAAAGYDAQAHVRIFDRLAETQGKTGSFFGDLFGTTRPDVKRLREMIKGAASLPSSCLEARTPSTPEDFQKWQSAVVNYTGLGRKEAIHSVVSKVALAPPLRGEVKHIRFSPDGKYLLAQDDSGINVMSREPFAALFRIDAPEASRACFTPDSQQIVFSTPNLRVEIWSVAEQGLKSAHEMVIRKGCLQTELSPDGKTLACLDSEMDLDIYDVASGAQVFQKKSFYTPDPFLFLLGRLSAILNSVDNGDLEADLINMGFSPDSRYFAAGQKGLVFTAVGVGTETTALVFDLTARAPLPLRGRLKALIAGGFAFLGPDRLVGADAAAKKGALVSFPSGELIQELPDFGRAKVAAATNTNFLLLRPIAKFQLGVMDLTTRTIVKASKQSALDVYGQEFASERLNGEMGLYANEKNQIQGNVVLAPNPLGRLRASALSSDFKWLAVSERSRGAVWELTKGERIFHVRGFRGGYFTEDGSLYADFPELDDSKRSVVRLDTKRREAIAGAEIKEASATQYGPYVAAVVPAAANTGKLIKEAVETLKNSDKTKGSGTIVAGEPVLEVRDARTHEMLWTRPFPKGEPRIWTDGNEGTIVLAWQISSTAAKAEIKNDPTLSQRLGALKEKEGVYLLQVVNARDGNGRGSLLIETGKGSFNFSKVLAAGEWVVISDTNNRVLVYSLSTGAQVGKTFGGRAEVGHQNGLLCVENEPGQLNVYDIGSMEKRDQFTFSSRVSFFRFSPDGKKLFVLTAGQTAYVLDLSGAVARPR